MEANGKISLRRDHDVLFHRYHLRFLAHFDKSLLREAYIEATLIAFWERAYNWSETLFKEDYADDSEFIELYGKCNRTMA